MQPVTYPINAVPPGPASGPAPGPAPGPVPGPAPGPVLIYASPTQPGTRSYEGYRRKESMVLGVAQIVLGLLCIIFNAVALGYYSPYRVQRGLEVVGHGFWCGCLFLVTGGLGIGAGTKKTRCRIVSFMVMCIISASSTISLLVVGSLGAVLTQFPGYGYDYDCRNNYYGYHSRCPDYSNCYYTPPCPDMPDYGVMIAMESCLAIAGFIEAIVAIWGSVLCCKSGVCCCSRSVPGPANSVPVGYLANYNGQIICVNQTQLGAQYVFAPAASQPLMPYPQGLAALPPPYAVNYYPPQPGWAEAPPLTAPCSGGLEAAQPPPEYPENPAHDEPKNEKC